MDRRYPSRGIKRTGSLRPERHHKITRSWKSGVPPHVGGSLEVRFAGTDHRRTGCKGTIGGNLVCVFTLAWVPGSPRKNGHIRNGGVTVGDHSGIEDIIRSARKQIEDIKGSARKPTAKNIKGGRGPVGVSDLQLHSNCSSSQQWDPVLRSRRAVQHFRYLQEGPGRREPLGCSPLALQTTRLLDPHIAGDWNIETALRAAVEKCNSANRAVPSAGIEAFAFY
ncbi:uncharacterized protein LOC134354526 [Mobula hypostoma]|uniref:uncharacterized protein LOC134354526 n=1 Tax=Mobula hypostoma TaxID=723540 RepID=UPI002FC3D527